MSLDCDVSDIEKFKQWATRMGCPLESVPLDETLRRTFATQQGSRLLDLTRLIAPAAELAAVRHNILVHQLRTLHAEDHVAGGLRQQHPPAIQRMHRVHELRSQLASLRDQIAAKRQLLDALRVRLADNGRAATSASADSRLARANIGLLAAKLRSLDDSLRHERTVTATIAKLMPVQFNAAVHSEAQARQAIVDTIHTMHAHYDDQPTASAAAAAVAVAASRPLEPTPLSASGELWQRLGRHVANVPNCLLWSSVSAAQARNVDAIKALSAAAQRSKHLGGHQQSARSQLEHFLTRARAKHIGIQLAGAAATRQLESAFDESVMRPYQVFMQRVHQQARQAAGGGGGGGDYDSATVDAYIAEYTAHQYNRGQLDFVLAELASRQREYATRCARLGSHTAAIGALQAVYADTERRLNEMRDASAAMHAIKQKLQFLEGNMRALVLEARDAQQQQQSSGGAAVAQRRQLNGTFSAMLLGVPNGGGGAPVDVSLGGSFDLSRSSDLCSTRMDETMQAGMADGAAIATRGGGGATGVQHVAELLAYVEATMAGLAAQTASVDTLQQLGHDSVPQHTLLPAHLYRLSSLAQRAHHTTKWCALLEQVLVEAPMALPALKLDEVKLMQRQRTDQHNSFVEMHDKCTALGALVQSRQQLADQLCAFLVDEPLHQYMPAKTLFNNRSYKDYEDEFMAHFRIVANAKEQARLESAGAAGARE